MNGKVWAVMLASVLVGSASLASVPSVALADAAPACGSKENPCPLQKWMRTTMGPANASGDMAALAAALDKAATFAPDPSWNGKDPKANWDAIAKAGSAAARANDAAGVKAACKTCHDAFKEKYKEKFRTKAVP